MDTGWIKLHRKVIKWEWYSDGNTFRVFMHLLLTANYEDSRYKGYLIPRGSVVTGYPSLAKTLGISIQNVRTAFSHLKSTGEITVKSTGKFSVVTLIKYEDYQVNDSELTVKSTGNLTVNQQSTNSQLTTSKEIKKERSKEDKKILSESEILENSETTSEQVSVTNKNTAPTFADFWDAYPRKTNKIVAERAWKKLKSSEKFVALEKINDFCNGKELQFVAHPSTYINQKRWEDEVIEPTKKVEQTSVSKQYVPERDDWF